MDEMNDIEITYTSPAQVLPDFDVMLEILKMKALINLILEEALLN